MIFNTYLSCTVFIFVSNAAARYSCFRLQRSIFYLNLMNSVIKLAILVLYHSFFVSIKIPDAYCTIVVSCYCTNIIPS